MKKNVSTFTVGDTVVVYHFPKEGGGAPQLSLRPKSLPPVQHRAVLPPEVEIKGLPERWQPRRAWDLDSLVQLKCRGDLEAGGFSQGRTMRAGPSSALLEFIDQEVEKGGGETTVVTRLKHPAGLICAHRLRWRGRTPVFDSSVRVENQGSDPVTLEMLSSFSLGGMTPYAEDDAPNRLFAHRYRSAWSAEGRLETRSLEALHLERSWLGHSHQSERFGQIGSMPVRGFFPFFALEDREAGVLWGARLACPGSWQMEIFRKDDFVALSGGQADLEFGHWWKTLQPGESFETPTAHLACLQGDIDALSQRLVLAQESALAELPLTEKELPIVVNEWCISWGSPTHANLSALAERLRGTPAKYLVIDDGWAERPSDGVLQNGDWVINRKSFPEGLAATSRVIREAGLIPGIWFEFEVCSPGSKAFALSDHHLQRDGAVLQVGSRRFWDFRDPFTFAYLTEKVIDLLRDNDFGYLKVDYNDTIGLGVDGAESPGEGLRQHLEGLQAFFRKLREALPELVIENCSSGGHRLEPSMQALCSMGSFSDAHETREIPIIAANLQRLILPRQCQVWAVLRQDDSLQRLAYSLAANFLGRMCLSGEVYGLSPAQWKLTLGAMELYRRVYPIIRDGVSTFHGATGESWRHPQGWQAVLRRSTKGDRALLVVHSFAKPFEREIAIDLPEGGGWKLAEAWPERSGHAVRVSRGKLRIELKGEFRAAVCVVERG